VPVNNLECAGIVSGLTLKQNPRKETTLMIKTKEELFKATMDEEGEFIVAGRVEAVRTEVLIDIRDVLWEISWKLENLAYRR